MVGQGHRVKVKVVLGVLYPIDSREVRHAGVFMSNNSGSIAKPGNFVTVKVAEAAVVGWLKIWKVWKS